MIQKYFILLIFSFQILASCDKKSDDYRFEEITSYFITKHDYLVGDNTKAIFVLTSIGCKPCNKKFSELMITNQYAQNDIVYLIKASKNIIDLSDYKSYSGTVFYDFTYEDNIFDGSKVIFINNKKIDTIVNIEALTLEESFSYIKDELQKK